MIPVRVAFIELTDVAVLAVAVTLGLSQQPASLAAPYKLNVNGNMVVMTPEFAAALEPDTAARLDDPLGTAHDFAAAIGLYRRKPVIGVVHRFSSHSLMLRYWLASAGIDPDRDVALRVVPPSLTVEALRGVEKTLTFRSDWLAANPDTVDRLLHATARAAAWCDEPANREDLAAMLADMAYLDQPADVIARALAGSDLPMPGASAKVEGAVSSPLPVGSQSGALTLGPDRFFDGRVFDPDRIGDHLAGFPIGAPESNCALRNAAIAGILYR